MVQARVLIAIFTVRAPTHFLSKLRRKERVPLLFGLFLLKSNTTLLLLTHNYIYLDLYILLHILLHKLLHQIPEFPIPALQGELLSHLYIELLRIQTLYAPTPPFSSSTTVDNSLELVEQ